MSDQLGIYFKKENAPIRLWVCINFVANVDYHVCYVGLLFFFKRESLYEDNNISKSGLATFVYIVRKNRSKDE